MRMDLIESPQNTKFKTWMDLTQGRSLKKSTEFILSGEKLIAEFLKDSKGWEISCVLLQRNQEDKVAHFPGDLTYFQLAPELFKQLDLIGSNYPLLILKQKSLPPWSESDELKGFEVILPLGDPQNLGSAIRSACAFGATKIILTQESANPYHPKAVKASAGAVLSAPIYKTGPQSELSLQESCYGLDLDGISIFNWQAPKSFRIILGEEGMGLAKNFKGKRLTIPMQTVESLNAQTSLAILAYEIRRQQSLK